MLAKRDLFALLLSAFAVYYGTRSESFVTFDRAWYLPLDPGGNAPRYDDPATRHGVDNHPPPPLFVDLNGDGEYEIIAASASAPEIRVFAQPANNGGAPLRPRGSRATDDVFAGDAARWEDSSSSSSASSASSFGAARTIAVASLIPENVRVSAGRRAIALAAGHLVPAGDSASSRSARKAVVVVVTEGWHVLCFDHNLRLMWERTLQESFPRHARVREVAVMVSDASMFEGDEGAVIVGGRVELGDVADAADEDPLSEELSDERMLGRHRGGVRASREEMARDDVTGSSTRLGAGVDASRHFDYHAFEGSTGAPRWRHESRFPPRRLRLRGTARPAAQLPPRRRRARGASLRRGGVPRIPRERGGGGAAAHLERARGYAIRSRQVPPTSNTPRRANVTRGGRSRRRTRARERTRHQPRRARHRRRRERRRRRRNERRNERRRERRGGGGRRRSGPRGFRAFVFVAPARYAGTRRAQRVRRAPGGGHRGGASAQRPHGV